MKKLTGTLIAVLLVTGLVSTAAAQYQHGRRAGANPTMERLCNADRHGSRLDRMTERLDLTDEQRATLEGLRERTRDGKAERHGRHADKRGHHEALIKALETGEVDEAACEAKVDGLGEKIERKLAERNERLATLHATLTPEQRATLVEQVRAKFADLAEHRADKGTGGFHGKGHHGPQMIKKLTAGLELTAEQRAQIDELVEQAEAKRPTADQIAGKIEEKKARVTELLDAFAAAEFDPAKLTAPQPMKHLRDRKACHQDQLEGLIDILTAEQRAELAEQIKSKPFGKHGCRGKGGCDGMGGCGKADCDGMGGCGRGKKHGPGDGSGPRAKTGDCPYANAE